MQQLIGLMQEAGYHLPLWKVDLYTRHVIVDQVIDIGTIEDVLKMSPADIQGDVQDWYRENRALQR